MRLGYCTNVHAGTSLVEAEDQLEQHATRVREHLQLDVLPIGLWLPASALPGIDAAALRQRLDAHGLQVFTMNAFPLGDFHQDVVKLGVYEPDWTTSERMNYTLSAAGLLSELLDAGDAGGISTLPIGWRCSLDDVGIDAACDHLHETAIALAELEQNSGRCIHLDIEPEPGCVLGTLADLADCFQEKLLGRGNDECVRRHLRACIDLCHAAVMFEDLEEAINRFDDIGLHIGKVQVSNAIEIDFDEIDPAARKDATTALGSFDEPRWMHQTAIHCNEHVELFDDLGDALAVDPRGCWRVHFHVPVHARTLDPLGTTQARLVEDLALLASRTDVTDWEVETYAWDALPVERRADSLSHSIATELEWTREHLENGGAP